MLAEHNQPFYFSNILLTHKYNRYLIILSFS